MNSQISNGLLTCLTWTLESGMYSPYNYFLTCMNLSPQGCKADPAAST